MSAGATVAKEVKKRVQGRKDFAFEFTGITFPSHRAALFRVTLKSVEDGVLVWVECKKTKQQWQATVTSVADCGPAGVPEEAVIQFLKVRSCTFHCHCMLYNDNTYILIVV